MGYFLAKFISKPIIFPIFLRKFSQEKNMNVCIFFEINSECDTIKVRKIFLFSKYFPNI